MKRIAVAILLLALALPAPGQEPPKDKVKDKGTEETPAQQYKALIKEYQDAQQAWSKAHQAAKTDEERQKTFSSYPQPDKYAPKFLTLAEKNPKDPAALDALVWIVSSTYTFGPNANTPRYKALAILERDYLKSDKIADVCASLMYRTGPDSEKFLRQVLAKNPHKNVQGVACLALAQTVKNLAGGNKGNPKEVEELLERAAEQYGDVKLPFRGTVGERAKAELFEVRFLAIGKTAPEVAGEDQDGVQFKLSDYRGKVVLIDFWGNW